MKHVPLTSVAVCLFALCALSGCRSNGTLETGMPVIDRWMPSGSWMRPRPMMDSSELEYADPPAESETYPVPAPAPSSAQPEQQPLPAPGLEAAGRPDALYNIFQDEAGHTPVPGLGRLFR